MVGVVTNNFSVQVEVENNDKIKSNVQPTNLGAIPKRPTAQSLFEEVEKEVAMKKTTNMSSTITVGTA